MINISRFEFYTPCKEDATKEYPGVASKLVAKVLHAGHELPKNAPSKVIGMSHLKKTDSFETGIFKEPSGYVRGDTNLAIDDVDSVTGHGDRKRGKRAGEPSRA